MRSIQSTSIVNGLQKIDVRICTMISEVKTSLASSCPDCNDRIGTKCFCKNESCNKEFTSFQDKDIVKGYEVAKGDIHNLTDEQIEGLKDVNGQMIVLGTIPLSQVDFRTLIGGYYLSPASSKKSAEKKSLEKMFVILRDGLFKSDKAIVVQYAVRSSQKLGLLIPHNNTILIKQIAYGVELREFDEQFETILTPDEAELGNNFVSALKEINPLEVEHQWSNTMEEILKGEPLTVETKQSKDELSFFK